jgi:hypothetical protein
MFIICKKINKKEDNLEHIKVAEVTHSVFYAPLYVAIEKGYFQDYGLDIELILTPGADKVSAAVLSDDVEIGFCGPESSIYVYNGKEKDYIQSFAGLTKRDGQFIVSRKNIKNFKMEDLIGKEVLAGRKGGMPVLNFENALINSNIDKNEVNINTSVEFSALSGSFIGGQGDFVNLFEPNATKLEKEGYGYVVGSVGMISGEVPYTAFNAKKSYIKNNKETLKNFNKAINEGLKYVKEHDEKDIANAIINQFPDSSINDVTTIVKRYKESDSWLENTFISEKSFKNLEDIMIKANLIKEYVPYKDLIININNE